MAKKPQSTLEWMKYITPALIVISGVSGFTMLKANVSQSAEKITKLETKQEIYEQKTTEITVNQVRQEAKLDNILEALKSVNEELKNDTKRPSR